MNQNHPGRRIKGNLIYSENEWYAHSLEMHMLILIIFCGQNVNVIENCNCDKRHQSADPLTLSA